MCISAALDEGKVKDKLNLLNPFARNRWTARVMTLNPMPSSFFVTVAPSNVRNCHRGNVCQGIAAGGDSGRLPLQPPSNQSKTVWTLEEALSSIMQSCLAEVCFKAYEKDPARGSGTPSPFTAPARHRARDISHGHGHGHGIFILATHQCLSSGVCGGAAVLGEWGFWSHGHGHTVTGYLF
jgi:hypothetical protein